MLKVKNGILDILSLLAQSQLILAIEIFMTGCGGKDILEKKKNSRKWL